MIDTIEARVARGAALLDEKLPGWVDRINLDRLDLGSPCRCILGQTWEGDDGDNAWYDPFELHSMELFDSDDDDYLIGEEIEHGFNAAEPGSEEFDALTAEWRRLILARRAGAEVSR